MHKRVTLNYGFVQRCITAVALRQKYVSDLLPIDTGVSVIGDVVEPTRDWSETKGEHVQKSEEMFKMTF